MQRFYEENMRAVAGLEPQAVLRQFAALSCVPRGSHHTDQIAEYCAEFARARGLRYVKDAVGNVVIYQPGSVGREHEAPVILQGHTDMVIDRDEGCGETMETDGVRLKTDGDWLTADGTTLGGDDGIAVALCLAVLDDPTLSHPPLEVVLTVDEEVGMDGARALDPALLSGRRMLNMDAEAEGTLWVSCTGGARIDLALDAQTAPAAGFAHRIILSGFHGGHSGAEIHKRYANAIHQLTALLGEMDGLRLISICGGSADNAIPRDAAAEILTAAPLDPSRAEKWTAQLRQSCPRDPDLRVELLPIDCPQTAWTAAASANALQMLNRLPDGVIAMSEALPGLVETSLNLGLLHGDASGLVATLSVRSSVNARREAMQARLAQIAAESGASFTLRSPYPAWEYRADSPLRDCMQRVYADLFGRPPVVTAIHAGLECGILSGKLPGLDCVSFGPDLLEIHTPRERMSLPSTLRTWQFLCAVLAAL
ncbi:MAG: beta-Ala-His dipeptidase [Clostridia bacterium]|nr:beta-Ala-His dipeptidase [Clostridia bacterium]